MALFRAVIGIAILFFCGDALSLTELQNTESQNRRAVPGANQRGEAIRSYERGPRE